MNFPSVLNSRLTCLEFSLWEGWGCARVLFPYRTERQSYRSSDIGEAPEKVGHHGGYLAYNKVELHPKRSEIKAAWPHIGDGSLPRADTAQAMEGLNDREGNEDIPQLSTHLLFPRPKDAVSYFMLGGKSTYAARRCLCPQVILSLPEVSVLNASSKEILKELFSLPKYICVCSI